MRDLHDQFFRRAKQEGYLSRAAYKLIEIDDRKRLVRRGDTVLDAGCAPGSWLQVLAKRVEPRGRVVGVDLKEVDGRMFPEHVRVVQGDLETVTIAELLGAWGRPDRAAKGTAPAGDRAPRSPTSGPPRPPASGRHGRRPPVRDGRRST